MPACVQDLSKESHGMQKLHQCPYPPQGCTSLVTSLLVSLADGPQKKALGVLWECFTSQCRDLAEDTVSEWLRRWARNPLGSARKGSNPFGVDVCACCLCPWPKNGKLEEAVGHQPPAHAHNFSCLAGVVWAKNPGFFSGLEPSLPMPRPTSFELFLAFSHGPLSMPQKASEHSLPHHHQPPWPNGEGVGLLIRRLWARD